MGTSINIYSICFDNTVRVVFNDKLKKELNLSIKNINDNYKQICKKLNIDYTTFWKYKNKKSSVPLLFFKKLKEIYNINLEKYFEYLESGPLRNKVKLIRNIDENLSKILGAVVADGNLRKRKTIFKENKNSYHYELVLREEYIDNCLAFCKWFNNIFDFNLKPIKRENHYEIYISNKIIFLILNKILEIPYGRKTEIIRIPKIIMNSDLKIRKAFLTGLFMFDGGVDYRNCYVSLVSRSKNLILDTKKVLEQMNLSPDYYSLSPDKLNRYRILFRKKDKTKKFMNIFEENTEKWYRLKEHFNGLNYNGKISFDNFINKLNNFYPRKRKSALTFSDFLVLLEDDYLTKEEISLELNRKNTVTNEFLQKLYKWELIEKNLKGYKTKNILPNIRRKLYG